MIHDDIDLALAKVGRITNIDATLAGKIGAQQVSASYAQDDSFYQKVSAAAGPIHLAISEDGRFHQDGFYGQARIVQEAIHELKARHVLELCSGRGFNLIYLAEHNPQVQFVGVDIIPGHIRISQKKSRSLQNLRCQVGDIETLAYSPKTFDVAFVIESLFHVVDLPKALSEAHRVLKPGGRMIVFDFFRKQELEAITASQRQALLLSELAFTILSPMSAHGFVSAARRVGFTPLEVEEISDQVLPDVLRVHRWVRLAFIAPPVTWIIANLSPRSLIDVILGWELLPALFKANLMGYFRMQFERS